jgi:hypothetical protein
MAFRLQASKKIIQAIGLLSFRHGGYEMRNGFPPVGDDNRFALADQGQVPAKAVFQFTAAHSFHVATSNIL